MLNQVLKAVEESQGPVRLQELSRKLNIDPAVLDSMLEFWIRKGRIRRAEQDYHGCDETDCPAGCRICSVKPLTKRG